MAWLKGARETRARSVGETVQRIVWKADGTQCRTSGGGGGIGDRDGKDVAGTGEEGGKESGREGGGRVGNKLWREECGAHVHRICIWKERGTLQVVDRARKIVPFLRFTRVRSDENLSRKKEKVYIRMCVCIDYLYKTFSF